MIVRPAIAADHDAVLAILRAIPQLPQWTASDLAGEASHPASHPIRRTLFVSEGVVGVCGFAQVSIVAGEAELEGMAVAAEARRNGAGAALLAACLHWASHAGAAVLRLEVRSGNTAALALYRSAGFEADGARRSYYRHPTEDAVLMRRNL